MKSPIEEIMIDTTLTDAQKVEELYNQIKIMLGYITMMHDSLAEEEETLDGLMDANGNNSEEHHAKTMVFYGRKLSIKDVFFGVKSGDPSNNPPLSVAFFTGLNKIISEHDYDRVAVTWDCWNGYIPGASAIQSLDNIWKTVEGDLKKPTEQYLEQKHMLGSSITMPTIRNMDNDGIGTGTNEYKLKSGYTVNGWTFASVQYQYTDDGNNYVQKVVNGTAQKVQDLRIFAFGSNSYKLPYKPSITPYVMDGATKVPDTLNFVLNIVPIWFTIEFVVRHGTVMAGAPCTNPIKTRLGNVITLPLTTLITMDPGYKIDTSMSPYGSWTTVDPNTGTDQTDPDGDTIPEKHFIADSQQLVGQDLDAGIRHLYLMIATI